MLLFVASTKPRESLHQEWAREMDHMQRAVRLTHGINWNPCEGQEYKESRLLTVTILVLFLHPTPSEGTCRAHHACFFHLAWQLSTRVPSSQHTPCQPRHCPDAIWKEKERDGASARVLWGVQQRGSSRGCPLDRQGNAALRQMQQEAGIACRDSSYIIACAIAHSFAGCCP